MLRNLMDFYYFDLNVDDGVFSLFIGEDEMIEVFVVSGRFVVRREFPRNGEIKIDWYNLAEFQHLETWLKNTLGF